MLKNLAGGVDERSPLCINVPPEDDVSSEFTAQQTSRLPVPPRSRGRRSTSFTNPGATTAVLLGDDSVERGLESSYRRLSDRKGADYDGYADQQLTSSLDLSTSSNEFVSIQVCVCICKWVCCSCKQRRPPRSIVPVMLGKLSRKLIKNNVA